jgi:hypothetical protein
VLVVSYAEYGGGTAARLSKLDLICNNDIEVNKMVKLSPTSYCLPLSPGKSEINFFKA